MGVLSKTIHQAAWSEIDQASTREADKDQDRPARCGLDYIASRGGDQNQTGAGQGLCERRETGSRAQTRLRFSSSTLTFEADKE